MSIFIILIYLINLRNIEMNAEGLKRLYSSMKGLGYTMTIGLGKWVIEMF